MTICVSLFRSGKKKKRLKLSIWPQNNVQESLAMKGTEAHDRKDSCLRYSKGCYNLRYSTRLYDRNKATQSLSLLLFFHVERQNENNILFNCQV